MFPKLGSRPETDIKTANSTTPKRGRSTDEDIQQENKKVKNPTNARRSKVADNTIEISEKAIFNVGKRRSLTLKSKHIQHNPSSDQQIVNQRVLCQVILNAQHRAQVFLLYKFLLC